MHNQVTGADCVDEQTVQLIVGNTSKNTTALGNVLKDDNSRLELSGIIPTTQGCSNISVLLLDRNTKDIGTGYVDSSKLHVPCLYEYELA